MQVILLDKIHNLGQLGDVVRVKDGYARNFLIPKGKARRATQAAKQEFELKRVELERVQAEHLQSAQEIGGRLQGITLRIGAKAGVDGRLFGSVTSADIVDALGKQGFEVPKTHVRMPQGPLKAIGDYPVAIALHTDVVIDVTVSVVGEHV